MELLKTDMEQERTSKDEIMDSVFEIDDSLKNLMNSISSKIKMKVQALKDGVITPEQFVNDMKIINHRLEAFNDKVFSDSWVEEIDQKKDWNDWANVMKAKTGKKS